MSMNPRTFPHPPASGQIRAFGHCLKSTGPAIPAKLPSEGDSSTREKLR